MFNWFEQRVHPYPDAPPAPPPRGFVAFLWSCTLGMRPYLLGMTLLTAVIGAFEALLFAMMGHIVDWLAAVAPAQLWTQERMTLLLLALVLAGSIALVAVQSAIKQQALAGNFPMLLRWKFHRLMLAQSMGFYQDEFAGRIAAKVMQTALAVRDVWMILAELLVFVVIYFVTMMAVVGAFDAWLLVPFLAGSRSTSARSMVRAEVGPCRPRTGRCALLHDRAHHRRIHQHRDGQALFACAARGGLRARGDAGIPADRARADAAGDGLRNRQPRAVRRRSSRAPRASRCGCGSTRVPASARSPRQPRWRCG